MKMLTALTIFLAIASQAFAGMICNQVGNSTFCNDGGRQLICNTVGNSIFCN